MNKKEIVNLSDEELIKHYQHYKVKLTIERKRHNVLQCGWAYEELEKRNLKLIY